MIKKFRLWLMRYWKWYRHRSLYVIADPSDNSITLSRNLFDLMDVINQEEAKVFVFKIIKTSDSGIVVTHYGFCLNPDFEYPTQLCDIQYNSKYRTIGFETLCPTVNRILYDYALPKCKTKLSVEPSCVHDSMNIYIILPPYDKSAA